MASKPDFQIPMPVMSASPPQQRSPMRSPRFHEDFDAPFSEAIITRSDVSYFPDSGSPTSSGTQDGFDEAWPSEPKRRASVNDKVLQWAKRSLTIKRQRSPHGDSGSQNSSRRSSVKNLRANSLPKDTGSRPASRAQAFVTGGEVSKAM